MTSSEHEASSSRRVMGFCGTLPCAPGFPRIIYRRLPSLVCFLLLFRPSVLPCVRSWSSPTQTTRLARPLRDAEKRSRRGQTADGRRRLGRSALPHSIVRAAGWLDRRWRIKAAAAWPLRGRFTCACRVAQRASRAESSVPATPSVVDTCFVSGIPGLKRIRRDPRVVHIPSALDLRILIDSTNGKCQPSACSIDSADDPCRPSARSFIPRMLRFPGFHYSADKPAERK